MQAHDAYFTIDAEALQDRSLAELAAGQPLPLRCAGLDLSGQDLSRISLPGAWFERCPVSYTHLRAHET